MALGSNIDATYVARYSSVTISAVRGQWQTIIDANGPTVQDAATITNPTTQITASTRHILDLKDRGTILELSLGYDDDLASITNPVVKVFGRLDSADRWATVLNLNGDIVATLTTATTTNVTDGTLKYTTPHPLLNRWDVGSYREILVGVQTVLAGTGTVNNSIIQARIWG